MGASLKPTLTHSKLYAYVLSTQTSSISSLPFYPSWFKYWIPQTESDMVLCNRGSVRNVNKERKRIQGLLANCWVVFDTWRDATRRVTQRRRCRRKSQEMMDQMNTIHYYISNLYFQCLYFYYRCMCSLHFR